MKKATGEIVVAKSGIVHEIVFNPVFDCKEPRCGASVWKRPFIAREGREITCARCQKAS